MRGNANDPNYITDAEYDLFEGNDPITGDALFDLAHRYTMGQVAANWNEAHANGTQLQSSTLSNRLQNVKERMAKQPGGRPKRELTQECQDAAKAVGVNSNGKATQEVNIPWPPRRPTPAVAPAPVGPAPPANPTPASGPSSSSGTAGASGLPTSGRDGGETQPGDDGTAGPAPDDTKGVDEDESLPANTAPTTTGEGDKSERGEDKSAPRSTTAKPKGKGKKRATLDNSEEGNKEEGPRAKRPKTRESAPTQQPSEGDRGTDEASGSGDVSRGEGVLIGGVPSQEPAEGGRDTGEVSGSGGVPRREDVPIGGGYEAVKGDSTTTSVLDEWREAKDGPGLITNPKDDVAREPPLPILPQQKYHDMGFEGTARETREKQKEIRETVLSFTPGEGKAAQAGLGVSKTNGNTQKEVDGEALTEIVETEDESENEDGGQETGVGDGVVEESDKQDEDENDA